MNWFVFCVSAVLGEVVLLWGVDWVQAYVVRRVREKSRSIDPLNVVCSVSEAKERLGLKNGRAVRRLIYAGKLKARKSGGVWLVEVRWKKGRRERN